MLNPRKLSQDPVFNNLLLRDRFSVLRSPLDELDPTKRNGTASLDTVAAALASRLPGDYLALPLTDAQALPAADPAAVKPTRLYGITGDWNAAGTAAIVYVQGVRPDAYHTLGIVYDDQGAGQLVEVDVVAGAYNLLHDDPRFGIATPQNPAAAQSELVWRFIGDPNDNNRSEGIFSATNTLADATDMVFGSYAFNCTFKPGAYASRFGTLTNTCLARENFTFNVVGDFLRGLVVGKGFSHNTLGNYVANVSAGDDCTYNVIEDNVNGAVLQAGVNYCRVGMGCQGVILEAGCERVELYHCGDQFTVPAGTKDAVFRYNKLVDPNGSGGTPGTGYTDAQARAAQLNRTAPAGTNITLTAEAPVDYGTFSSGTPTIDATGCVVGKGACFVVGAGAQAPNFTNAPSGKPYKMLGASYASGKAFSYSLYVRVDRIEVIILAE